MDKTIDTLEEISEKHIALTVLLYQEKIGKGLAHVGSMIASQATENQRTFLTQSAKCGFLADKETTFKDENRTCLKSNGTCRMSQCPYVTEAIRHYRYAQGKGCTD